MCLIIEIDPVEVGCVWSQTRLPDVEVFLFLKCGCPSYVWQLWRQYFNVSEITSVEPGKRISYLSFIKSVYTIFVTLNFRSLSTTCALCNVLIFLPVFILCNLPTPLSWGAEMSFSPPFPRSPLGSGIGCSVVVLCFCLKCVGGASTRTCLSA